MNMMNKCAKFHKDTPSEKKKAKFNLRSAFELSETADFCVQVCIETNFVSKPGFFWAPKTKGGGAHCAPLAKTLLPFSESIQVNFSESLSKKWISWHNFGFHGNHG